MVILDFSKAFDTVLYKKLLHKMEQYGEDGNINTSDFLTNRKMKVVVNGEESEAVNVDSGVPQGTVLGPLLFLCHINDLPDAVKSRVLTICLWLGPPWFNYWFSFTLAYSRISHEYSSLFIIVINLVFMFSL